MKKLLIFLVSAIITLYVNAQTFEYEGLKYSITSEPGKTCEVAIQYANISGEITIPETVVYNNKNYTVTSIGNWALSGCSLTSITLPESLTSIGDGAFMGCSDLLSITLSESLESIGEGAFSRCTSLTSITLPESLTSIGNRAFAYCENLTTVKSYATKPPICANSDEFFDIPSDAVLHVPVGCKGDYAAATGWSVFNTIIDDLNSQSGVDEIQPDTETNDADENIVVYNLQGRRINISRRSELP